MERRSKQTTTAEKKLHKEITLKQEGDRKVFDLNRKKEYKANKERWKRELSMDESTPKRQRDLTLQSQKDNLKQHEAQEEQRMLQAQKQYIELEMRKFKRRRMIMLHELEDQLLRDVSETLTLPNPVNLEFISISMQELSKKQHQLEQAHGMLLKHHEKTQELEYRQQKSVHQLREEQVGSKFSQYYIYKSLLISPISLADKQATRHRVAQSKRLHGSHQEGAAAQACARTKTTAQEP